MEKTIKFGIFGLGRGSGFYDGVKANNGEVVAVCDFDEEKLKKAREDHEGIATYTDFDEFINHEGLEAVFLCNYFHEHTPYAIKALEKNLKSYGLRNKEALKNFASSKMNQKRLLEELKLSEEEIVKIANLHLEEGYNQRYKICRFDKLVAESVAIIKDAISQGIDYKILNEEKSVVEFSLNGKREFVIEGNKTDRDSYIFPIITDDKFIAKQIMKEASLNVPSEK